MCAHKYRTYTYGHVQQLGGLEMYLISGQTSVASVPPARESTSGCNPDYSVLRENFSRQAS